MSARILPLRLEAFEQLPKHARRCVFWEVDPDIVGADQLADPEFEKEAWLSMVMLEWGPCGQVANGRRAPGSRDLRDPAGLAVEYPEPEECLGYVLYAPPNAVPRAQRFPTGPVSADAVLLTSMGVEPGPDESALRSELIASAVAELIRRGVRALEAFGRTAEATPVGEQYPDGLPGDAVAALGDCRYQRCMIEAEFLQDMGFTVVSPHRFFPRLRLELDKGLGWKAEVEAALERLLDSARLEQPVGAASAAAGAPGLLDRHLVCE